MYFYCTHSKEQITENGNSFLVTILYSMSECILYELKPNKRHENIDVVKATDTVKFLISCCWATNFRKNIGKRNKMPISYSFNITVSRVVSVNKNSIYCTRASTLDFISHVLIIISCFPKHPQKNKRWSSNCFSLWVFFFANDQCVNVF